MMRRGKHRTSWGGLALAALACSAGCAQDSKHQPAAAKQAEPAAAAAEATPPAAQPLVAAATPAPQPAAAPAPVEIDPARMPVEEDYVEQAASRIGRSANLDLELKRIAAEIKAPSKK